MKCIQKSMIEINNNPYSLTFLSMKTYLIGFFSFILFGIGYYLFCTPAGAINRHIIHYDCTSLQINKIDIYEYMIKTPCYIAIKDSDM